ncbi:hypothetical protein PG994_001323 [Apiospora phragmitis]|uniref:Uncharacterized protein n=1 Tax=Apiospora phragmitis TaxID=2905665 RepID=A0ABR1WT66_9PEZI
MRRQLSPYEPAQQHPTAAFCAATDAVILPNKRFCWTGILCKKLPTAHGTTWKRNKMRRQLSPYEPAQQHPTAAFCAATDAIVLPNKRFCWTGILCKKLPTAHGNKRRTATWQYELSSTRAAELNQNHSSDDEIHILTE